MDPACNSTFGVVTNYPHSRIIKLTLREKRIKSTLNNTSPIEDDNEILVVSGSPNSQ